jgi:hypothetical protein
MILWGEGGFAQGISGSVSDGLFGVGASPTSDACLAFFNRDRDIAY